MLILYLSCTACTSWRPDSLTPQAVVQSKPSSLRVTRTDSSQVVVNHPQLQGDTIVGVGQHKALVRVPLDSVLLTDTRRADAGKSMLALMGVGVAVFVAWLAAYAIACANEGCSN